MSLFNTIWHSSCFFSLNPTPTLQKSLRICENLMGAIFESGWVWTHPNPPVTSPLTTTWTLPSFQPGGASGCWTWLICISVVLKTKFSKAIMGRAPRDLSPAPTPHYLGTRPRHTNVTQFRNIRAQTRLKWTSAITQCPHIDYIHSTYYMRTWKFSYSYLLTLGPGRVFIKLAGFSETH